MNDYWIIFKEEWLNKSVVITVAVHWALVVIAFLDRGGFGLPYHFFYESILLKIISSLDFPSLAAADAMGFPLNDALAETAVANIVGTVFIVTLQWILIGYVIGKILSHGKRTDSSGGEHFNKQVLLKDYLIIFKKEFLNMSVVIPVSTHWILVVIGFLIRGDLTSPISFDHEPLLLKIMFFLDLPAIIAAALVGFEISLTTTENDIYNIVGIIMFVTLQWSGISYVLGKILSLFKVPETSGPDHLD